MASTIHARKTLIERAAIYVSLHIKVDEISG